MIEWLALIGGTFGALLPIANPFSTAPVFAAASRKFSPEKRREQARRATYWMMGFLLSALFAGAIVLTFFGITVPILRMAGGVVVARVGFSMLNPDTNEGVSDEGVEEALDKTDISLTPIAMPLLSGPGSIAVTISMATSATLPRDYLAIAIGICLVAFVSWLTLRASAKVSDYLGVAGMEALTRIMGFLLVCIGFQFVATGLFEGLFSYDFLRVLGEAVQRYEEVNAAP